VAQYYAAVVAKSMALRMDCVSMAVDALTYMGNIFVECRKRGGHSEQMCSQLTVCAISLGCLVYFTFAAGEEAWEIARACQGYGEPMNEEGEDVNGWITLAFGLCGFMFDLIALWYFQRSGKKGEGQQAFNMFTAFLHVAADFLRSGSTVIMSLLILFGGYDSMCLDSYTSLLIGAMILAGASVGIYQWLLLAHRKCHKSRA